MCIHRQTNIWNWPYKQQQRQCKRSKSSKYEMLVNLNQQSCVYILYKQQVYSVVWLDMRDRWFPPELRIPTMTTVKPLKNTRGPWTERSAKHHLFFLENDLKRHRKSQANQPKDIKGYKQYHPKVILFMILDHIFPWILFSHIIHESSKIHGKKNRSTAAKTPGRGRLFRCCRPVLSLMGDFAKQHAQSIKQTLILSMVNHI